MVSFGSPNRCFLRGLPLAEQNLNGRLYQIVDELVRRGVTLEQARREFEKQFIVASLKSNRGNFCRSARSLGVHRNTLRNKVSDLGIVPLGLPAVQRSFALDT